ncbi:MAG: hypothetical protein WAK82_31275 [Streptosporangiaceae bacterium]
MTEPVRGLADVAALFAGTPWLARAPHGDGHGVLVWPGLMASDRSTAVLRRFLRYLGYDVSGWNLGRNRGPTDEVLSGLPQALMASTQRTGRPVSLVGWSLGGIYAREMARQYPQLVRQVITLGSPYAQTHPRQTHAELAYAQLRRWHAPVSRQPARDQIARPIPVPSTSAYSRWDGIVSWRACIEPETGLHRNVAVRCAHLGFGVDPATLWLIADRLATPAGQQIPFRPPAWLRALYPGALHPRAPYRRAPYPGRTR